MANATLIESPVPPITGKRVAPQTVALTGRNFMAKADAIAVHWYSLIDSVLETNKYGEKGKNEPLPQWAVERLNDGGGLNSDYEEHLQQINMSKDALRLAEDGESANAFEVWDRSGRHMSYRHPTFEDAQIALDKAKASGKCKEPFITRISRRSMVCPARAGAELPLAGGRGVRAPRDHQHGAAGLRRHRGQ